MAVLSTFCCIFSLRIGSFFAACFMAVAAFMFVAKDLTWIYVLSCGVVPQGLSTFVTSIFENEERNETSTRRVRTFISLATVNISEKHLDLTKRYIASYVLHAAWSFGGVISSICLMIAVINQHAMLILPWLSWSSVNVVIVGVNGVVDLVMWIHFKIHSSLNWFALFSYISLPFVIYLILIVASYFTEIEATASEPMVCACNCNCFRVWSGDELTPSEFSSPAHLLGDDSEGNIRTVVSTTDEEKTPIKSQNRKYKQKPKIKISRPSFDSAALLG